MIRRKRLGTTYTKSPAQETKAWTMANMNKIVFSIIISFCWLGILWVGIKIVIFLAVNVGEVWEDMNVNDVYAGPYGVFFKIIGIIGIILYVFKDKPRKR